jgi:hypothetical protein
MLAYLSTLPRRESMDKEQDDEAARKYGLDDSERVIKAISRIPLTY